MSRTGSTDVTSRLRELYQCCNLLPDGSPRLPEHCYAVVSLVQVLFWRKQLETLPDQQFAELILNGLEKGFRIGFRPKGSPLESARCNLLSTMDHPREVSAYIKKEVAARCVVRLDSPRQAREWGVHFSPLGVIPKKGRPNQWRLIMDLSAPSGASVNDGISQELCFCKYSTVADAARQVLAPGKGALLAKMDIKHAYRNIPVAPEDRHLLGFQWNGCAYIEMVLPFGLRSVVLHRYPN